MGIDWRTAETLAASNANRTVLPIAQLMLGDPRSQLEAVAAKATIEAALPPPLLVA